MRIGYMSDIHLRYNSDYDAFIDGLTPDVDVQIIAGDVIESYDVELLKRFLGKFTMPVVFVPGNHEYYLNSDVETFEKRLGALSSELPNVHVLVCGAYQVPNGPRIVGTTMWYRATPEMGLRHADWADFRYIRGMVELSNKHFLNDESLLFGIKKGDVVVTHMLPSWKCVDPRFEGARNNELFVRNVEPLIESCEPSFWIHGHTHAPVDVMIGSTRVLCNPRGVSRDYGVENPDFDPKRSFIWPFHP